MVYVYLPFMLFPMTLGLSTVPRDLMEAGRDMGASRLQIWREIELPLAMPGILIGMLLTFMLAVGAVAESKILGGQSIIVITHDIEIAFTYAQNWPLGSALAVLLMLVVSGLTLVGHRPARPRPHPGAALMTEGAHDPEARGERWSRRLIWTWTVFVVAGDLPADLRAAFSPRSASRAISAFPSPSSRSTGGAHVRFDRDRLSGADLARDGGGRHAGRGGHRLLRRARLCALPLAGPRASIQKIVLLPIFFPQPVLGLALLLWFNAIGLDACRGRPPSLRISSGSFRW